jgi:cephalosporin hydroxylase
MSSVEWIKTTYEQARQIPSDIFEHIPTLFELSKECQDIAELGVRGLVSTWAFLNGLLENNSSRKVLHCVDIEPIPHKDIIVHNVRLAGITMIPYQEDSAKVELPPVDLLFIDTFHVYAHLKRELAHHHSRVRKYIVMHDTVVDAVHGEAVRCNYNLLETWKKTGYPVEELTKGLVQAIQEFLVAHPEWKIEKHYMNNNGLTILKRV